MPSKESLQGRIVEIGSPIMLRWMLKMIISLPVMDSWSTTAIILPPRSKLEEIQIPAMEVDNMFKSPIEFLSMSDIYDDQCSKRANIVDKYSRHKLQTDSMVKQISGFNQYQIVIECCVIRWLRMWLGNSFLVSYFLTSFLDFTTRLPGREEYSQHGVCIIYCEGVCQ